MTSKAAVLDASALLAFLREEPGSALVERELTAGAHISAVNWAEVLSKLTELGRDPSQVVQDLAGRGILGTALIVHPADEALAVRIAELRPLTKSKGLSLGDRACLALASQLEAEVLTAERNWQGLSVGVVIRLIRH